MTIRRVWSCPVLFAALMGAAGCGPSDGGGGGTGAKGDPWVDHIYLATPVNYITEPEGFDSTMASYVPNFLFKVKSASGNKISMTMAVANDAGDQDKCTPTVDVEATVSSYPKMAMAPIDFDLYLTNKTMKPAKTVVTTIRNLSFTDVLPKGEKPSESGVFEAILDGREIYPLVGALGDNPSADAFCSTLDSFSSGKMKCESCPDGKDYCLKLKAEAFGADPYDDGSVTTVTKSDRGSDCPEPS